MIATQYHFIPRCRYQSERDISTTDIRLNATVRLAKKYGSQLRVDLTA